MIKTAADLISAGEIRGKRVLVRSDLNVPMDLDGDGIITDDGRVRASLPTIKALTGAGARVVVCAHLGRPKGAPEARYSLAPVARRLEELLGQPVSFATDTVGESARSAVGGLADGQVAVLENLRFNVGETSKDDAVRGAFADQLASLADVFVSDGFGVVHRKHASVYDVAQRLPHAMGGLVQAEVEVLKALTESPDRPFVVVLGGAKVADKLGVIESLLKIADTLLIGGGMSYTFLAAQGYEVGKSILDADRLDMVKGYLRAAKESGVEIVLPTDVVVAAGFSADAEHAVGPGRPDPARHGRHGHRPRDEQGLRGQDCRRTHSVLERPCGRVRDRRLRRGQHGSRPGRCSGDEDRCADGHRRRRLGCCCASVRLHGRPVRAHIDRWRCQP